MLNVESSAWVFFSTAALASRAVEMLLCKALISFSLERSCMAILLIRSSPVAIIFFNIGFSRSAMESLQLTEGRATLFSRSRLSRRLRKPKAESRKPKAQSPFDRPRTAQYLQRPNGPARPPPARGHRQGRHRQEHALGRAGPGGLAPGKE